MSEKRSQNEMSLMYMFFCTFLILATLIQYTMPEIGGHSFVYNIVSTIQVIITCGVHGFVFVSGYKLGIARHNAKKVEFPKLKKIILPFAGAVAVFWVFLVVLGEAETKPVALVKIATSYNFYIIWILAQFKAISLLYKKVKLHINMYTAITIALVVSLLSVTLLPSRVHKMLFTTYLVCYTIGYYAGKQRAIVCEFAKNNFVMIAFFYVASLIITESLTIIYAFTSNVPAVMIKQIVTGIYIPLAIIFILSLCVNLADSNLCSTSFFAVLKKSGYYIFLWHMLPITATSIILVDSEIVSDVGGFAIKLLATAAIVGMILYITYVKERKRNGTV